MTFNFGSNKNNIQTKPLYEPVYIRELFNAEQVKELLRLAKDLDTAPAQVGVFGNSNVASDIRRSNVAWITPDKCPQDLAKFFQDVFLDVNQKHFEFNITGCESFQVTIYEESYAGTYNWHIDTCLVPENDVRKISMSLLLTDPSEFEGGKLLLNNQGNIVVAEERFGGAIFFPSWMPHCVTPVTKGTRKTLVIWCHGPKFK